MPELGKESGLVVNFLSEVSEVVSSELHSGIMKAARRVILDEIIGNTITEFVSEERCQRGIVAESVGATAKTHSVDSEMVMYAVHYLNSC